jgi:hypothetical protein
VLLRAIGERFQEWTSHPLVEQLAGVCSAPRIHLSVPFNKTQAARQLLLARAQVGEDAWALHAALKVHLAGVAWSPTAAPHWAALSARTARGSTCARWRL